MTSAFSSDKPSGRVLGRSVPRLEDPTLVTGRGRFVGDISFPRQLHMRVVRSPYAHAELRAVDVSSAQAAPGVVAVWTVADIADLPPIDFRDPAGEALRPYRQPLLARDRLRYVGEPVAVVFASDAYLAEDAADLVTVEAEELPPLLDATATPHSCRSGSWATIEKVLTSIAVVAGAGATRAAIQPQARGSTSSAMARMRARRRMS